MSDDFRQSLRKGAFGRYGPGGALIDPLAIPTLHYDIGGLHGDAAKLKSVGGKVHATGERIDKRWKSGLPDHYDAPEVAELTTGTRRVVSKADRARGDLEAGGAALESLASTVGPLMQRLESLRAQASAFRGWALSLTGGSGTAKDWRTEYYPAWGKAGQDVNMSLCNQVGDALDGVERAEQACVSALAGHTDTGALPPPSEIPTVRPTGTGALRLDDAMALANDWRRLPLTKGANLPWGGVQQIPQERIDIFTKLIAGMFDSLVSSPVKFFGGLAGISFVAATDPTHRGQTGLSFSGTVAKQTWTGVGRMLQAGGLVTYLDSGMRRQNAHTLLSIGKGFIASDEKDGWVRTGKILGNVGSLVQPSPAKGVGFTHALESLAANGSRIAEREGAGWTALGSALKAPEAISNGAWLGGDARFAAKGTAAGIDFGRAHAADLPVVRDLVGAADGGMARHGAADLAESVAHAPTRDAAAAVDQAKQWAAAAQDKALAQYHGDRAALHQQKLRDLADASPADRPDIEKRYTDEQRALQARHDADTAAINDEAAGRIGAAIRTGLSTGMPDHDAARIRDIVTHTAAADRAEAVREYVNGLTPEERAALASTHPELVRAMKDAVPADMYAEANRAGAPVPSPDPDPGTFQRAWEHLPEPAQEKTLDIVLWRNGPLNTASLLPADFIWGDPKTAHDQYQTVLSYLQHHPDVAIAEYLRRHPGV